MLRWGYIDKNTLKQFLSSKDKSLYKSGHFHWGPKSRSHGWIDTSILLGDVHLRKIILQLLLDCINENSIEQDLLVGIGVPGNLIGSLLSTALNCTYSYLPDANKIEFNDFEKCISISKIKFFTICN